MTRLMRLPLWLLAVAFFLVALAFALSHDAPVAVDLGVVRWEGLPFGPLLLFAFVAGAVCGLAAAGWVGARMTLECRMLRRRLARLEQQSRIELPVQARR